MKKILTIILTAIISSVLFSFLWGLLFYKPTGYKDFHSFIYDVFVSGVLYFIIPFIISGLISVFIMDKASRSLSFFKKHNYLVSFVLYIIGGLIVSFLCLFFLIGGYMLVSPLVSSQFIIVGTIGSLLFFHLYLLARKVFTIK